MKTLDEVIEGFECCENIDCGNCPYKILFNDDSHVPCDQFSKDEDALHYLKDMKNLEVDYDILYKKYWREFNQQQENPALTWDELCSRNGMPVWIEDSFDNGEWYIIECFTASNRFVAHDRWGDTTLFNKKEMDDVWKAYRREHHENQH